jgi:hypothetical protein
MNEFDLKYDFGLKTSLDEKIRKEVRSTLKDEEVKLKGYIWLQQ